MGSQTTDSRFIKLQTTDDHKLDIWEVKPGALPPKAGVIVLQEIFGLTDYIKKICEDLGKEGYHVMAPALFDRIQPDIVLSYDEKGMQKGLDLRAQLTPEAPIHDIDACLKALRAQNPDLPVGVIGFCWGGYLAWKSAQTLPVNAAIAWYGGDIAKITSPKPRCPVQLHFGEKDDLIPASDREIIHNYCPEIPSYLYKNAGHGFGCTDRASYDKNASTLAWERSLSFFAQNLQKA